MRFKKRVQYNSSGVYARTNSELRDRGRTWASRTDKGEGWPPTPDKAPKTLGALASADVPLFAQGVVDHLQNKRSAYWGARIKTAEDTIRLGEELIAAGHEVWPAQWKEIDTRHTESFDEYRPAGGELKRILVAPGGGDIAHDVKIAKRHLAEALVSLNTPSNLERKWLTLTLGG